MKRYKCPACGKRSDAFVAWYVYDEESYGELVMCAPDDMPSAFTCIAPTTLRLRGRPLYDALVGDECPECGVVLS